MEAKGAGDPLQLDRTDLDGGTSHHPRQCAGELGRGFVATLLGEPGVTRDVEEADGRGPLQAAVDARL
jgi:hypothetical protein